MSVDGHTMRGNTPMDTPWQSFTTKIAVASDGYNHVVSPTGELNSNIIAVDVDRLSTLREQGKREMYFVGDSLFDRVIASLRGTDRSGLHPDVIKDDIGILENPTCEAQHDARLQHLLEDLTQHQLELARNQRTDTFSVSPQIVVQTEDVHQLRKLRETTQHVLRHPSDTRLNRLAVSFLDLVDYRTRWLEIHRMNGVRFWHQFYRYVKAQGGDTITPDRFVKIVLSTGELKVKSDPLAQSGRGMVSQSNWEARKKAFYEQLKEVGITQGDVTTWFDHDWKSQRHFIERKYAEVIVFQGIPSEVIIGNISRVDPTSRSSRPLLMPRFMIDPIYRLRRTLSDIQIEDPVSLPVKPALVAYRMHEGQAALTPRGLITRPKEILLVAMANELQSLGKSAPKTTVFDEDQKTWLTLELAAYEKALQQLRPFKAGLPKTIPNEIPEKDLRSWDKRLGLRLTRHQYSRLEGDRPYEVFSSDVAVQRAQTWLALTRSDFDNMVARVSELKTALQTHRYSEFLAETTRRPYAFSEDTYFVLRPTRGVGVPITIQNNAKPEGDREWLHQAKQWLDDQARFPSIGEIGPTREIREGLAQSGVESFEQLVAKTLGFESKKELEQILWDRIRRDSIVPVLSQLDAESQQVVRTVMAFMVEHGRMMKIEEVKTDPQLPTYYKIWDRFGGVENLGNVLARVLGYESYPEFRRNAALRILDGFYKEHGRFVKGAEITGNSNTAIHRELQRRGISLGDIHKALTGREGRSITAIQDEYAKWKGFKDWKSFWKREILLILDRFYKEHGRFIEGPQITGNNGTPIYAELKRREIRITKIEFALTGKKCSKLRPIQDEYAKWKGFENWDRFWKHEVFLVLDGFYIKYGRFLRKEEITGDRGTPKYGEVQRRKLGLGQIHSIVTGQTGTHLKTIQDEYAKWKGCSDWESFERQETQKIVDALDWMVDELRIFEEAHVLFQRHGQLGDDVEALWSSLSPFVSQEFHEYWRKLSNEQLDQLILKMQSCTD